MLVFKMNALFKILMYQGTIIEKYSGDLGFDTSELQTLRVPRSMKGTIGCNAEAL